VEHGAQLVLVYNFRAYPENTTNPQALLERLYLRLGHARFVEDVHVFGNQSCRYSCLPIVRLTELPKFVDELSGLDAAELARVRVVRYTPRPGQTRFDFTREAGAVVGALAQRFELVPRADPALPSEFTVDGLRPRGARLPAPVAPPPPAP
jgi:hypothetical protein